MSHIQKIQMTQTTRRMFLFTYVFTKTELGDLEIMLSVQDDLQRMCKLSTMRSFHEGFYKFGQALTATSNQTGLFRYPIHGHHSVHTIDYSDNFHLLNSNIKQTPSNCMNFTVSNDPLSLGIARLLLSAFISGHL